MENVFVGFMNHVTACSVIILLYCIATVHLTLYCIAVFNCQWATQLSIIRLDYGRLDFWNKLEASCMDK